MARETMKRPSGVLISRTNKSWRLGWKAERVLQHIRDSVGTHFDPEAVRAFEHLHAEDLSKFH